MKTGVIRPGSSGNSTCDALRVANPGSKDLPESETTSTLERPVCDEWGMYDPEQAGFEALARRLLPDEDDSEPSEGIAFAPD
jgi:hypothetical protein